MFDEIACGGMATIHLGRMRGAGGFSRTVAVKRMHPHISRSPDFVAMFLDEARIVARVSHPNVVSTLDLVEDEGDLFIIMEYVEGLSLAALLRAARARGERAPIGVTARVVTETLRGLHAAHEASDEDGEPMNIVHRDISPENVLVGVDGYPRVLDFGVARASVRLSATRDGQVKGKVAYMAPEQVLGQEVDRRTDVYAVSAILWQALTGRRLWKAEHLMQLAHRMLNDPIDPPSLVSPDLPKSFDAIVLRGLERNIANRWESAAAMADALEAVGGLASHREVGLWVRRLGSEQLTRLAATVAAVEAKDKARRGAAKGRPSKPGVDERRRAEAKQAQLMAEAERDAPRGPPVPDHTGQVSGVTTPTDDLLWGKSEDRVTAAGAGLEPSGPTADPVPAAQPVPATQPVPAAATPASFPVALQTPPDGSFPVGATLEQTPQVVSPSEPPPERFSTWSPKRLGLLAALAAGVVIVILMVRAFTSEDEGAVPVASAGAVEPQTPAPLASPAPVATSTRESPPPASATAAEPSAAATVEPSAPRDHTGSPPSSPPGTGAAGRPPPTSVPTRTKSVYSQD